MMPGAYDLRLTSADGSEVLLDLNPMTLAAGDVQTILTMGDLDDNTMDVMAIDQDGNVTDMTGFRIFLPVLLRN